MQSGRSSVEQVRMIKLTRSRIVSTKRLYLKCRSGDMRQFLNDNSHLSAEDRKAMNFTW
jgi:hypothetical protein